MKLILEGIKLSSLFIALIAIFPPLSVAYSGYKHKVTDKYNLKEGIIINALALVFIIAFILMGILDWSILLIYAVFLFQEVIFEGFRKTKRYIKVFDRVNITAIATALFLFLISNYIIKKSGLNFEQIKELYKATTEISEIELNRIFEYIKSSKYIIWFIYAYLSSLIIHLIFYRRVLEVWYMSYIWVVLYIIVFALGYFFKESIFINNAITILKIMLGVYGLKFSFFLLKRWDVNKIVITLLILGILMVAPQLFFIIGAIRVLII